jgi:glycosyltransferase involved in cell wall biosynthesis
MSSTPARSGPQVAVLTPTYNRASLLPRLYQSLCEQTFTSFEWIVIDDGSTDATRELVESWEAPFRIVYTYQENAGTKVAWNRGVELVESEYVAVIGSDDWYLPEGLARLVAGWEGLDERFVSVNGRTVKPDGGLNGPPFTGVLDADSFSYWYRHRLAGDTIGLARAAIVKRFPFPYATSRSATEALAFNRIARHYLTRFIADEIAVVDYQPDGLSARSDRELAEDPIPWLVYYWEALTFPKWVPLDMRARFAVNCLRYGLRSLRGAISG